MPGLEKTGKNHHSIPALLGNEHPEINNTMKANNKGGCTRLTAMLI